MPASIVLVGLASNYPNPGVFAEIDFAQGPSGPAPGPRNILIMGNKTSAGSATPDTVVYGPDTAVPVQSEADFITVFGTGSQVHRAFLRITAVFGPKGGPMGIYAIAVTESAGAQASTTSLITNTSTGTGNLRVWVVDDFVDTAIGNGDTAITVATNACTNINSKTRWPVTAANSGTATITITAKNHGPEGNWIKAQTAITGTSGCTTGLTTNSFLTSGATADVNTSALATIVSTRYYYILSCDSDTTNFGRLVTQVNSQALPLTGIRQRCFAGSADTPANANTVAIAQNSPRAEYCLASGSDLTPLEIAANDMAIYALLENSSGRAGPVRNNYSLFPTSATDSTLWVIKGTRSGPSGALTTAQITSALNNGVTPLNMLPSGALQLVKRVTTRSLNGATQDYRTRDAHKVSIPDWWTDDAVSLTQLQFGGKDLLNDPVQGQSPPGPLAVTPRLWGDALKGLVDVYANAGQLQNATTIKNSMITQRETSPTTRLSNQTPLQPVDIADQFALQVLQVA